MTTDNTPNLSTPAASVTTKGAELHCECQHWADDDFRLRMIGNGHHRRCQHYAGDARVFALLSELVKGIKWWADQEDGVPDEVWDAYEQAKRIVSGIGGFAPLAQTSDAGAGGGADGGGKWTPEPWIVGVSIDSDGWPVFRLAMMNDPNPDGVEAQAVAVLMKASPKLYSALSDLLDEQNGPPLIKHAGRWQAAVDAARSALALARGEVQK